MDGSQFHQDERTAQALAGVTANGTSIRSFMPDQHRRFFAILPYILVAGVDGSGWPIATVLAGSPGFIRSPDSTTLQIEALPDLADPIAAALMPGCEIGLLGIDLETRRRNRANGRITERSGKGLTVAVRQSFGNCAKYIQRRIAHSAPGGSGTIEHLPAMDDAARRLIAAADTFFVASRSGPQSSLAGGADISHRGGRPGFVRLAGDTLTITDFRGNRYFNTLGNLLGEPRAALLFIDFERGDLLHLRGTTEVDWDRQKTCHVDGAERSWRFSVISAWRRSSALPLTWSFLDYAPTTMKTGIWQ